MALRYQYWVNQRYRRLKSTKASVDYKLLISILGQKDLCDLPIRVQRFKLRLTRYGFEIFHLSGKNMLLTDALSSPCASFIGSTDQAMSNKVELLARSSVDSTKIVDCRLEEVLQVAGVTTLVSKL